MVKVEVAGVELSGLRFNHRLDRDFRLSSSFSCRFHEVRLVVGNMGKLTDFVACHLAQPLLDLLE